MTEETLLALRVSFLRFYFAPVLMVVLAVSALAHEIALQAHTMSALWDL